MECVTYVMKGGLNHFRGITLKLTRVTGRLHTMLKHQVIKNVNLFLFYTSFNAFVIVIFFSFFS